MRLFLKLCYFVFLQYRTLTVFFKQLCSVILEKIVVFSTPLHTRWKFCKCFIVKNFVNIYEVNTHLYYYGIFGIKCRPLIDTLYHDFVISFIPIKTLHGSSEQIAESKKQELKNYNINTIAKCVSDNVSYCILLKCISGQ